MTMVGVAPQSHLRRLGKARVAGSPELLYYAKQEMRSEMNTRQRTAQRLTMAHLRFGALAEAAVEKSHAFL